MAVAIALVGVITKAMDSSEARPRPAPSADLPARPSRAPGPNAPKPGRLLEPRMPVLSADDRAQIAEQVRGQDRPGEAAFRLVSDRYVDENLELAQRQAAAEGLTLAEVRELTFFGLLVLATQRHEDLEQITGRPLNEAARDQLADLMHSSNTAFRESMRALVGRGGSEEERWKLIRGTEASYRTELFRIAGLDGAMLDDLLAGNMALPGAPAGGTAPEGDRSPNAPDPSTTKDQPQRPN
jgi:hypothetical protein